MRVSRLAAVLVPVTAAALFAAASSARKDPHGVYAVVDSVIFEPSAGTPERVRLWGSFALANVVGMKDGKIDYIQFGHFHPPQPGFMYYSVNPRDETGTRADWAELKEIAGTGQAAAWGASIPPAGTRTPSSGPDTATARWIMGYNGRVRASTDPPVNPDVFPQRIGRRTAVLASPARATQLGLPVRANEPESRARTTPPPRRD